MLDNSYRFADLPRLDWDDAASKFEQRDALLRQAFSAVRGNSAYEQARITFRQDYLWPPSQP